MSTDYNEMSEVPTDALVRRLRELSDAVTKGPEAVRREYTMRVPAELDRDADLVIAASAERLARLTAEVERLGSCLRERRDAMSEQKYIEVRAEVRYWEDATVNGDEDLDGKLIPCREGDLWCPVIDLQTGAILDWPEGTTASIQYKVCDQGEYWLQDASGTRIAKWRGDYVPDNYLCPTETGDGDYIIFDVGADGVITAWGMPDFEQHEWEPVP